MKKIQFLKTKKKKNMIERKIKRRKNIKEKKIKNKMKKEFWENWKEK